MRSSSELHRSKSDVFLEGILGPKSPHSYLHFDVFYGFISITLVLIIGGGSHCTSVKLFTLVDYMLLLYIKRLQVFMDDLKDFMSYLRVLRDVRIVAEKILLNSDSTSTFKNIIAMNTLQMVAIL